MAFKKALMAAHEVKLPWDLIEEILSRVPPKSLVRFRAVCKPWNNLFNDKTFINNHKMTFQFVLKTKSKIYSVSVIDVEIVVREITLNIPGSNESHIPRNLVNCNEFLLCRDAIWNPWSRQSRKIVPISSGLFEGIGYDEKRACYKLLASLQLDKISLKTLWRIYDFASDTWKDFGSSGDSTQKQNRSDFTIFDNSVSLGGSLYSLASQYKTNEDEEESLCIACFEFSGEESFAFCDIPCERNDDRDALVLGVFKGDRFSLLKQCFETTKIEIWMTKNKISLDCGEHVVWMSFMQVSIPNFPSLVEIRKNYYYRPSYFIDDKRRLIVCSCDETGRAWIYVMSKNKLISKTRIDLVVDLRPLHCTYFPSLVSVAPLVQQEQDELQV